MKTVNELKKLPASQLSKAIDLEIVNCRKLRETELNTAYLGRHPELSEVPTYILEDSETLALHYTIGGLQTLLWFAICKLQQAESEIEAYKQGDFHKGVQML